MGLLKKLGMIGATGLAALSLSGKADAGLIYLYNRGTPINGSNALQLKNVEGALEGDDSMDTPFMTNPLKPSFEIYTQNDGGKMTTDAKSVDAFGWNFYLSINDSLENNQNYIRYIVADTTDLIPGQVQMWDLAKPDVKYDLIMDGLGHNIILSDLVNQPAGEYAQWYLQLREQEEPSNPVSETGAGAIAALAAAQALRQKRRTLEGTCSSCRK